MSGRNGMGQIPVQAVNPARRDCPSRIFGGAEVLCFVQANSAVAVPQAIGQPVGFGRGGGWTDTPVARQPKSDIALTLRGNSLHSQLSSCPTFVPMMKTANLRQSDDLPKVRR